MPQSAVLFKKPEPFIKGRTGYKVFLTEGSDTDGSRAVLKGIEGFEDKAKGAGRMGQEGSGTQGQRMGGHGTADTHAINGNHKFPPAAMVIIDEQAGVGACVGITFKRE